MPPYIQQDTVEMLIIRLKGGNLMDGFYVYFFHCIWIFHRSAIHSCSLKAVVSKPFTYKVYILDTYVNMSYVYYHSDIMFAHKNMY